MLCFAFGRALRGRLAAAGARRSPLALAAACALAAPLGWSLAGPSQAQAQSAAASVVVVTANRAPQPLSTVLADVSVVTREEIERSGAFGVADLLARLPGVEISRTGGPGAVSGVFIRGGENRHTAVYLDGVRVDSQAVGGAVWEQLPLEMVERIEVLRGPAAAVYGSDAVAGVVQVFTRRGQGALRTRAALTLGAQDTAQAQVGVSGGDQALDYSLSAAHGRSRGFDARTTGVNPDADGWRRASAQGRIGWQLDAVHRLEAGLLVSRLRAQYDDDFSPGQDDVATHLMHNGHLAWQARWSPLASTRLQLGQTDHTYESQPSFYRTETTLRDFTLQHEQRLGDSVFNAVLERREDRLANAATAFSGPLSGQRHQNALGLGWRAEWGVHALQLNARHDHDSEFGGKATGLAAWGWRLAPQWRLKASVGTAFRAPTLYQRFSEYGNAGLVPEHSRNRELGLDWADAASGSSLGLNLWRNTVSDLIAFGAAGPCANAFGCYVNVGRARLQGVTLAGKASLAGVRLQGALDWHDPKDVATGKLLPRRARQLAKLGAETDWAGWTLGAELQASGQRFENAANTQRLGGYTLLNLSASTTLAPGLRLQARLDNVGDKAYALARNYATTGRSLQLALRWAM